MCHVQTNKLVDFVLNSAMIRGSLKCANKPLFSRMIHCQLGKIAMKTFSQ